MSNNIDDIFKNQDPIKEEKKGSKVIVFLMILFIIILGVVCGVTLYYLKNQDKVTPKDEFIKYLGKGNIQNVFNLEKMNNLNTKLQSEQAEMTTDLSFDGLGMFLSACLDSSDLKLKINSKNNPEKKKNSSDISILYKDNELLELNVLSDKNKIGVISNEVANEYIGSKYSNLNEVLEEAFGIDELLMIDFEQLINTQIVFPQLSNEVFNKYIDVINQKIPETAFSSKGITLERNNENISVTEFSMKLTETQIIELIDVMSKTFENDDELLDLLFASFSETEGLKEIVKGVIEQGIASLYEKNPDDTKIYTLKVYGANDVTYKISIDLYGEKTIDLDYEDLDKSNSITITALENESQTGFSLEIIKKLSDVSETFSITVNVIENSEIIGKIGFVSDLISSGNSYTLKNKIDTNLRTFTLGMQSNSKINFKNVQIDDLTSENCVFLDEQDEETVNAICEIVGKKAESVINEKLVKQGYSPFTENYELNTAPPSNLTPEGEKEEAKNKLIKYVSLAMGKAESENRKYKLSELMNLSIPDSTVSVSIDGDVAEVNIDGFEFKINSEFQLYE